MTKTNKKTEKCFETGNIMPLYKKNIQKRYFLEEVSFGNYKNNYLLQVVMCEIIIVCIKFIKLLRGILFDSGN